MSTDDSRRGVDRLARLASGRLAELARRAREGAPWPELATEIASIMTVVEAAREEITEAESKTLEVSDG